uniref:(northern house mosquito) hypothetical protein n=1 Tax=Culex pipiens TaxID=7175 RepID=A0A8D8K0D3_CULPI
MAQTKGQFGAISSDSEKRPGQRLQLSTNDWQMSTGWVGTGLKIVPHFYKLRPALVYGVSSAYYLSREGIRTQVNPPLVYKVVVTITVPAQPSSKVKEGVTLLRRKLQD